MQFGGTPMQPSPSSTGVTSPSPLLSISAPINLEDGAKSKSYNNNERIQNGATTVYPAFPGHTDLKKNSMYQNNGNGQLSNGPTANGSVYTPMNQQSHQQPAHSQLQLQQQPMNNGNVANNSTGSLSNLIYPALHLQPLNDTFAPKQISLAPPGPLNKVKIGRQTNNKTIPQPSNGYFDSKVLSRMHAEVWSQDGKVFIKDVKSSNGTFINGSRLSPEGQDSDTFELHSEDIVEFGIDIVGEDNKSIIHHKVACRAFLVTTAEEALGLRHDFAALYRGGIAGGTLNNHSVGPGAEGGLRRSKLGSASGAGFGNNGNNMMSFDHILHKLQAELQKSRETASELGNLNTAMSDIGETLGGGLPPMSKPPYQHLVPSTNGDREGKNGAPEQNGQEANKSSDAIIKALEDQVLETQRALQKHTEQITGVEARLEETDSDVDEMRSQVEEARKELSEALRLRTLASRGGNPFSGRGGTDEEGEADFDDGASMASVGTVVQGSGREMVVDEVESSEIARQISEREEDVSLDDAEALQRLKYHVGPPAPADGLPLPLGQEEGDKGETLAKKNQEELTKRLESIESQLERALDMGKTLAEQHAEATEAVKRLEERVRTLESEQETKAGVTSKSEDVRQEASVGAVTSGGILALIETKWTTWRDAFESDFAIEKVGLREDREELKKVIKIWDGLNAEIEDVLESDASKDEGTSNITKENKATNSNPMASAASKKRRKKRAAASALAAATSASSVRSPSTNSVGLAGSSSLSTSDSTARINRELRALLYTESYNALVKEEHLRPDGDMNSIATADREGSAIQSDEGNSLRRGQSHLTSDSKRKPPGGVVRGGLEGPAALPMLSVAGVVVFGMTAWVLSGGKAFHLSGGSSGGM